MRLLAWVLGAAVADLVKETTWVPEDCGNRTHAAQGSWISVHYVGEGELLEADGIQMMGPVDERSTAFLEVDLPPPPPVSAHKNIVSTMKSQSENTCIIRAEKRIVSVQMIHCVVGKFYNQGKTGNHPAGRKADPAASRQNQMYK